jgi:hypothetical protein
MLQYSTSFLAPIIPYISYSIPTTTCGPHTSYSYSPSLPLPSPFNLLQAPPTRARCILPRRDSCSLRPLPSPPPPAGLLPPCSLPTPADPWRAALSLLSMLAIGPFLSPPPSLRGGDPWLPPPRTSSSSSSARRQSGARRSLRLELGAPSSPPAGLEESGGRRWPRDRAPGARRPQPRQSSWPTPLPLRPRLRAAEIQVRRIRCPRLDSLASAVAARAEALCLLSLLPATPLIPANHRRSAVPGVQLLPCFRLGARGCCSVREVGAARA